MVSTKRDGFVGNYAALPEEAIAYKSYKQEKISLPHKRATWVMGPFGGDPWRVSGASNEFWARRPRKDSGEGKRREQDCPNEVRYSFCPLPASPQGLPLAPSLDTGEGRRRSGGRLTLSER